MRNCKYFVEWESAYGGEFGRDGKEFKTQRDAQQYANDENVRHGGAYMHFVVAIQKNTGERMVCKRQ